MGYKGDIGVNVRYSISKSNLTLSALLAVLFIPSATRSCVMFDLEME
ncbi:hypothetical protein SAMN05421755_102624 [Nitrosomonas sp. Nm33]|nr:hypothetical protein SAMN05421755_102624 [Nitrosomonas sp. Nm33]